MSIVRRALLAGSESAWLRRRASRLRFVRRSVNRFMPGETAEAALAAAAALRDRELGTVFTCLGENVTSAGEAQQVARHYVTLLDRIREERLPTEISVKLTHLGLDFDRELCAGLLAQLIEHAGPSSVVWVDMEASRYVDSTLEIFRRARSAYPSVGVCVQAYLRRTEKDVESLIPLGAAIRLVKGAYREPPEIAFTRKAQIDENFFALSQQMLGEEARRAGVRAAIATHDPHLIRRIQQWVRENGFRPDDSCEFQMLYGIQRALQQRLGEEGWKSIVLIAYGSYWFPWFMRRLAERPANTLLLVRNLF